MIELIVSDDGKRLLADLGEPNADDFFNLVINTLHVDDIIELNEMLNKYVESKPKLFRG